MSDENVEREKAEANKSADEHYGGMLSDIQRDVYIAGYLAHARASRPREAGSGAPDEGSKWYTGDGEAFIVLPPNEVRRLRIEAAQSMRAAPVVPITHTVAPEACPVAEKPLAWTAFSESSSWTGVWCKTREGAQERVDEFKRRWPKTGPYRVVPLYAQPASAAGREGVARFIEECDERHNHRCACYAMSMENRRCDEAKSIAAIRALLAAEAEERGEKEA